MNIFEEINFFKDIDVNLYIPMLLTFMKVPSYYIIYAIYNFNFCNLVFFKNKKK